MDVQVDAVYTHSEHVVAREIEGELIIVPLIAGIGDMEDELYTLNETGREVWKRMDGETSLRAIAADLALEYQAAPEEIEGDVLGLVGELVKRKMLVEVDIR